MTYWIFDLDGTLTVPQHDFADLKRILGLPPGADILGGIAARPAAEQPALHEIVRVWEAEHIANSAARPAAAPLLDTLVARGDAIGILTRNTRDNALATLDAIGLRDRFTDDDVLGRDTYEAKPAPDGIEALLDAWNGTPDRAVMVGDWVFDLEAGRNAGTRTVWLDLVGDGRFASLSDLVVPDLQGLLEAVGAGQFR